jgi:hypothetical protein
MSKGLRIVTKKMIACAAVIGISAIGSVPRQAEAYPKKVENACKSDYSTHCPAYKEGSAALRNCMSLAGKRGNLSRNCVNALIDAGYAPKKYRKK